MKISARDYTFDQFSHPTAVYVKCQVSWSLRPPGSTRYRQPSPLMYVGSTKISVAKREWNRMSVYRRLLRTEHVQAELALRYWRQHSNLHCFSLIKVASLPNYKRAWTVEHLLTDRWQPRLNFPFVTFFLQRTALAFVTSNHSERRPMFPLEEDYGINSARSCINLHSRVFFNCIKKKLGAYYLIYAPEPRQLSKPRKTSDPDVGRMLKSMPASDFPTVWSNPSNIMFVQDFSGFVLFVAWSGVANRLPYGYCR